MHWNEQFKLKQILDQKTDNQGQMDPKDFQGIQKWKFLIPGMYIVSWILMIVGPIFFPYAYQIYCIIIIVYSLLKTAGLTFGALVALIMIYRTIKELSRKDPQQKIASEQALSNLETHLYHAIIIPSYKQEEEVLLQTLGMLAKSPRAKSQFIILMAMEAHEKGSDQKARGLISKMKDNFYFMSFSQHQVREGEMKGKASNVSWCAEHVQELIAGRMINTSDIMLTIMDADSWAPPQYFQKVEMKLKEEPEIKDRCMFSAPQIYTRNHLEVPVFNRVYDQMHSLVHLANLVAIRFSFPLSNYSLSYNCAKKIGFWDTCADAIGEDFHTCQKCHWKLLDERFVTVPIYVPFNQFSLSTGEGYISDIKARFWQAERHTLGVTDVAYSWSMLFKTPFRFRNFILNLLVTQVFAMAAVIPWALLALGIQYKLVNNSSIHFFPMWVIDLLLNATPVFTVSSYIFYEWWKRVSNRQIYHQQNDKWWRVLEYPILFMVALFGFSVPAFLMASFAVLCTKTQYKVAQKRMGKDNVNPPLQLKQIDKQQSEPEEIASSEETTQRKGQPKPPQNMKKIENKEYLKEVDEIQIESADSIRKPEKV